MKEELEKAIQLRKADKGDEALATLKQLLLSHPEDPLLNYQAAWTCDYLGKESEAVPFYEKALEKGLSGEDKEGAMLGLGSTYRCLGRYQDSLSLFNKAVEEFPDSRQFKVFRALTLHNLKRHDESVEELLIQLLDTTADESIRSYEKALRFYSDKLNETWIEEN